MYSLAKCILSTASAFGDEQRRMLKIIQCFGKHCSCHLQGKYVIVWCFSSLVLKVGGELDETVLPAPRLSQKPIRCMFSLNISTLKSDETLRNV